MIIGYTYTNIMTLCFVQILIVLRVLGHLLIQMNLISLDMCADTLETTLLHGPTDTDLVLEIKIKRKKKDTPKSFYWTRKIY